MIKPVPRLDESDQWSNDVTKSEMMYIYKMKSYKKIDERAQTANYRAPNLLKDAKSLRWQIYVSV